MSGVWELTYAYVFVEPVQPGQTIFCIPPQTHAAVLFVRLMSAMNLVCVPMADVPLQQRSPTTLLVIQERAKRASAQVLPSTNILVNVNDSV